MVYIGESSRTWYDRSREHNDKVRLMDESNPMVKHQILHHPEEEVALKLSYKLDKTWCTSLKRQIREALLILDLDRSLLRNSKAE